MTVTTNAKAIDKTEGNMGNGNYRKVTLGSGGVTAGYALKLSSGLGVVTSGNTSVCYGVALQTGVETDAVLVAGPGCRVKVPFTLTADGYVECASSGAIQDYTSGTKIGIVESSATLASIIRLI
jgi:hypothetical protein